MFGNDAIDPNAGWAALIGGVILYLLQWFFPRLQPVPPAKPDGTPSQPQPATPAKPAPAPAVPAPAVPVPDGLHERPAVRALLAAMTAAAAMTKFTSLDDMAVALTKAVLSGGFQEPAPVDQSQR